MRARIANKSSSLMVSGAPQGPRRPAAPVAIALNAKRGPAALPVKEDSGPVRGQPPAHRTGRLNAVCVAQGLFDRVRVGQRGSVDRRCQGRTRASRGSKISNPRRQTRWP